MPSGAGWPLAKQRHVENMANALFHADVRFLCEPNGRLKHLLSELHAALPALSDAITHTYFSHAELEQST
jgi:hypothetical protein